MKTEFTPGPWFSGSKRVWANETEDRLGMEITLHGGNNKDNNANARLIAAAPDLYAALELILDREEISEDYIKEQAIAALKRARGEE